MITLFEQTETETGLGSSLTRGDNFQEPLCALDAPKKPSTTYPMNIFVNHFKTAFNETISMKRFLSVLLSVVAFAWTVSAQSDPNARRDNILGVYLGEQHGDVFKARITKSDDGAYMCQIFWMENDRKADGSKRLDTKNPDKSLRGVPCDEVVLFSGLKYNEKKLCWDGTKIYDPQRGFKAALSAKFTEEDTLRLTGTVMGISGHFNWKKLE